MEGAPVISSYQERGLLTLFPVHDKEDLDKLDIYWSKNTFSPPLDQIRNYFGESVALYWSFAQTYTRLLVIISTLGLFEFSLEQLGINYVHSNVIFALLNLLSLAVFSSFVVIVVQSEQNWTGKSFPSLDILLCGLTRHFLRFYSVIGMTYE